MACMCMAIAVIMNEQFTCANVSQKRVQSDAVIIQVPWLVVAMGPFTLHQERPRHSSPRGGATSLLSDSPLFVMKSSRSALA